MPPAAATCLTAPGAPRAPPVHPATRPPAATCCISRTAQHCTAHCAHALKHARRSRAANTSAPTGKTRTHMSIRHELSLVHVCHTETCSSTTTRRYRVAVGVYGGSYSYSYELTTVMRAGLGPSAQQANGVHDAFGAAELCSPERAHLHPRPSARWRPPCAPPCWLLASATGGCHL